MGQPLHAPSMEPVFNPLSPEFIRDPYPHYHRLRTADPMHRSPLGFFVASRNVASSPFSPLATQTRDSRMARRTPFSELPDDQWPFP